MDVISLQSGSEGNSFFIEAGDVRLLVDAGISGCQAEQRLARHGRQIRDIQGLLITHDHRDHSRCLGVYHRKFNIPVYVTRRTLAAAQRWNQLGKITNPNFFLPGQTLAFENGPSRVLVHSLLTPHDGAEGVAYVIEHEDQRVGILTDLGHVFDGLRDVLLSLDAVVIESNYDPHLLKTGPYPDSLKRRISGPFGHLSNHDASKLVSTVDVFGRLRWACLCHLSQENNSPDIAVNTFREHVSNRVHVHVASRVCESEVMTL